MNLIRVAKIVLPSVVILAAGVLGINFLYNTYLRDDAATVISLEPAAGDTTAKTVEDTVTAPAAAGGETVTATPETTAPVTEAAPATEPTQETK